MFKMEIKKVSENIWEIPKEGKMLVPGRVFASEKLLDSMKKDSTLQQIKNVACLKGIQKYSLAMSDAHSGYGFSIGGVAAFDLDEGIISPGGVGYDINCGVRVAASDLSVKDFLKKREELLESLYNNIPSGVGKGGKLRVSKEELAEVSEKGVDWAIKQGYATKDDKKRTEEYGSMKDADFNDVSDRAIKRGIPQLGTLGAGNHFLEVQEVGKILDEDLAKKFGINKDNITVMIHCGSRGFGHQIATDYIKLMEDKFGWEGLPDRELINAPFRSDLGQKYYKAMCCGSNFAFVNRQIILNWVRETFNKIYGDVKLNLIYDVAHNIAKVEKHKIDGKLKEVCMHRKGATRSFGPGREELGDVYKKTGQPILIPGSMGTSSYVLVGTNKAEEVSFGSTAHGAGRVMSRSKALHEFKGEEIKKDLEKKNILVKAGGWKSIAEEAPNVYKDVDEVVKVSHEVGIGNLVVKLKPLAVIKG